jgi:hypothetical protein
MGPANADWYRDRGLLGSNEQVTVQCAAGRIDIYGLDETEYYGGMYEYSVLPMKRESWDRLADWLDEFETQELWSYDQIIAEFESQCGDIEWID